jgi:pyruvate dehydrogenase E2 component (dihydrolipoamide acetyltransferase)
MALLDIMIPDVREGVTKATVLKWHVKAFDRVQESQLLAEVVLAGQPPVSVPSPKAGIVLVTHAKEGEQVRVRDALVLLDVAEASAYSTVYQEHRPPEATPAQPHPMYDNPGTPRYPGGPPSFMTQFDERWGGG